jgi:hypothetical protein
MVFYIKRETEMTRKQAIATAQDRVRLVPFGDQWTVHRWSPKMNATWVSHPMEHHAAQIAVWEDRVQTALELLGVEDAGAEANIAAYDAGHSGEDWRTAVRRLADWYANDQPRGKIAS